MGRLSPGHFIQPHCAVSATGPLPKTKLWGNGGSFSSDAVRSFWLFSPSWRGSEKHNSLDKGLPFARCRLRLPQSPPTSNSGLTVPFSSPGGCLLVAQWGVTFIMFFFNPMRWCCSLSQLPGPAELKHKATLPKRLTLKHLLFLSAMGKLSEMGKLPSDVPPFSPRFPVLFLSEFQSVYYYYFLTKEEPRANELCKWHHSFVTVGRGKDHSELCLC